MIEFFTLLSLLILLFISLMTDKTSLVLPGLVGLGMLGFWLRPHNQLRSHATRIRSLPWGIYWLPGLVLLADAGLLVMRPTANDFHLGLLLAIGWVVILSRFSFRWYQMRQPPPPARKLMLQAEAGTIQVNWQEPDDPRYAESLLVRSPATTGPDYPEQGEVLCRGPLSAWCDHKVEPGRPYAYMVFSHNGRGGCRSTPGHRIYAAAPSRRRKRRK
jgi:hypothetical protein